MRVTVRLQEPAAVLEFSEPDLRVPRRDAPGVELEAAVAQTQPRPVVLSFAKVGSLSSGALGALVSLVKRLRSEGRGVVLSGLGHHVSGVMAATRLDQFFEIETTLERAVGLAAARSRTGR